MINYSSNNDNGNLPAGTYGQMSVQYIWVIAMSNLMSG